MDDGGGGGGGSLPSHRPCPPNTQDHLAALPQNPSTLSSKILVPLLKALYDADILEEEQVVGWWAASGKRRGRDAFGNEVGEAHGKVRKGAEPLVRWLEEAEEDESEEEDSG